MFKTLNIILQILGYICSNIDSDVKIIKDITSSYDSNTFFLILGYEKNDAVSLMTALSRVEYQSSYLTISTMSHAALNSENNAVFLLNFNSESVESILLKANEINFFAFPLKWLIINNDILENSTLIFQYFDNLNILVDSDVNIANKLFEKHFSIVKIYKRHKEDTNIIAEDFGKWNFDTGFQKFDDKVTAERRQNLQQTALRTAIVITHNDTLNHLIDYRDKHIDSITKVNYILVNHLADMVNATLNYTIQSSWGYKTNASIWTGMIGELTEDRADIGGTPLFVTTDRVDIIDYIAMTTPTRSNFVFRQPKLSYVTNVFTLPFHWTVWLSTVALVVITTIWLYFTLKWEEKAKDKDGPIDMQPKDALMLSFGAMCQQGASSLPEKPSGRIVTLFIFVSLMFLYVSYSANIVALLQSSSNSIQTLEDLLKSRLAVGVDDTVFNQFYFPAATEPIRRALYLQKVSPKNQAPRFLTIEEGVKKLRAGLFAFHMEGGSGYKLVGETFYEDEKCDLKEISFLQVPDPWLAIQKNSSYKEMLKIGLRKIQESGLQSREVSRIYTKKPQCHGVTSSFVSVGLIDIYAAIVVYLAGFFLTIFIFFTEIFIHKKMFQRFKRLL